MRHHFERSLGRGVVLLALAVTAWQISADREALFLPPGYGAAGDRERLGHMPAAVRAAVRDGSAGAEGSWVKQRADGGAWVYELHVITNGKPAVLRIAPNGAVTPSAEAGE